MTSETTGPRAAIVGCLGEGLSAEERALFRASDPLGLILFRRNCTDPAQVRALAADFRETVGRADAPVLIDQEGGRVQRLRPPHWRDYPPAAVFGTLYEADPDAACEAAWLNAALQAAELAPLGITVNCAPMIDVRDPEAHDIVGDRAFSGDPDVVIALGRAVMDGLMSGGVLPVIKHVPGHGRARADSHEELPVVEADRAALARDFAPFRALADAPFAMTAHVVYTALDAERPATLSRAVVEGVMRGEIGIGGAILSDDLSMKALSGTLGGRAAASIAAGCDVALHCNGEMAEMAEVLDAVPRLSGAALARVEAALARVRRPAPADGGDLLARRDALLAPVLPA